MTFHYISLRWNPWLSWIRGTNWFSWNEQPHLYGGCQIKSPGENETEGSAPKNRRHGLIVKVLIRVEVRILRPNRYSSRPCKYYVRNISLFYRAPFSIRLTSTTITHIEITITNLYISRRGAILHPPYDENRKWIPLTIFTYDSLNILNVFIGFECKLQLGAEYVFILYWLRAKLTFDEKNVW
jgi:hypothetical protein